MSRCRSCFFGFGSALLFSVFGGCHDSSGAQLAPSTSVAPTPSVLPAASAPLTPQEVALAPVPDAPTRPVVPDAAPAGSGAGVAGASDASGGAPSTSPRSSGDGAPALVGADGKALAQSDERPTLSSASFQQRVSLVAHAIVTGDTEPAAAAFFPLLAYQQVKDVAKPERDYKFRLLANFKRDILEYHRALGASASAAQFEGITVSEKDAKWMAPGSEGNKVGYFRVLRSRLRFTLPTGRTRDFELTSMISWRGEWYVVHLHGFK